MRKLADFFIKNDKLTIIISFMILLTGLNGVLSVKSESFPNVDFATAIVTTNYRGASPSDIETKITKPIEDEIKTVQGLKDVRSVSGNGMSLITIRVDMDNENVPEVMDELKKAVDKVGNLPFDLQEDPEFKEINSQEFPVITLALSGSEYLSRAKQAKLLSDKLKDIKGVSDVTLQGYSDPEFKIEVDKEKLTKNHISLVAVDRAIKDNQKEISSGLIKDPTNTKIIRLKNSLDSVEKIENIIIRNTFKGKAIQVKDVATVTLERKDLKTRALLDGEESINLVVTKKAGKDTIQLVKEIKHLIDKENPLLKKSNLSLRLFNDQSIDVQNRLLGLSENAITGFILVVIFLLIFLPGKIGVMASLSLPLAVLATLSFFPLMGTTLNVISILAVVIALGMMVDNAVVISENYTRLRVEEKQGSHEAALNSIDQLWLPITSTALTTISAFLPMLVTKGIMGKFIMFIPIIVTLALIISLAESFFLLPMRLVKIDVKAQSADGKLYKRFESFFEGTVRKAINYRYLVLFGFIGVLITSGLFMFKFNKFVLFPTEKTKIYEGRITLPKGYSLDNTFSVAKKISQDIVNLDKKNIENTETLLGVIGNGMDVKDKSGDNEIKINIHMTEEASVNIKYTDMLKKLRENIKINVPNSKINFDVKQDGPPVGTAINFTFKSDSSAELDAFHKDIKKYLEDRSEVLNISDDISLGEKEIFIEVNDALITKMGLSYATITQHLQNSFKGIVSTTIVKDNEEISLKLKYKDSDLYSFKNLQDLKVENSRGYQVPLSRIVKFKEESGSRIIKHFDFKRSVTISADITEKTTSVKENSLLATKIKELVKKYRTIEYSFGGEAESTKESLESLSKAMVFASLGIFGLLVFMFNSYWKPFIIMTTIPLGLLGFSIAFVLFGKYISFLSLIGLIGLAGILVNASIILISFIEEMKKEGKYNLEDIMVKASKMRLKAILVTSMTTFFGLVPSAFSTDPLLAPMCMSMAFGLLSGTILTLIWIPAIYLICEDFFSAIGRLMKKVKA